MKRECQLTGKRSMVVNNVSKSNRKVKSRSYVNIIWKKLPLEIANTQEQLRIAAKTLKTIYYKNGLANFVLSMRKNRINKLKEDPRTKGCAKVLNGLRKKIIYALLNKEETELTQFELELKNKFLKSKSGIKLLSSQCRTKSIDL